MLIYKDLGMLSKNTCTVHVAQSFTTRALAYISDYLWHSHIKRVFGTILTIFSIKLTDSLSLEYIFNCKRLYSSHFLPYTNEKWFSKNPENHRRCLLRQTTTDSREQFREQQLSLAVFSYTYTLSQSFGTLFTSYIFTFRLIK